MELVVTNRLLTLKPHTSLAFLLLILNFLTRYLMSKMQCAVVHTEELSVFSH